MLVTQTVNIRCGGDTYIMVESMRVQMGIKGLHLGADHPGALHGEAHQEDGKSAPYAKLV